MKALVIFESAYGNTHAVAEAVAEGIREGDVQASVVPVAGASSELTRQADLLVVGGPTHARGMSRPGTRRSAVRAAARSGSGLTLDPAASGPSVRDWLSQLDRRGVLGAAFGTRLGGPVFLTGSAAAGIARQLRRQGVRELAAPRSFVVTKTAELRPGELARAREWGTRLAQRATAADAGRVANGSRAAH